MGDSRQTLRSHGATQRVVGLFERGLSRIGSYLARLFPGTALRKNDRLRPLYVTCYSKLHRRQDGFDVDEYEAPLEPYRARYLNPDRIELVSGRPYPPFSPFRPNLGRVSDGDWDEPTTIEELDCRPEHEGTDPALYHAEAFEDSVFHRAMVRRFEEGVDWEDTVFYQEICERIERGETPQWHCSETIADVEQRARTVDQLFARIKTNGYRHSMALTEGQDRSFRSILRNNVLVDIGRDGEPRFVDGRHRLSIAKILDISPIPVITLVRHSEWMRERDDRFRQGDCDHFDFPTGIVPRSVRSKQFW